MRVSAPRLLLPLLLLTMLAGRPPVGAQSMEGTVRIQPPTTPDARVDDPFAVYIELEDLQHEGLVEYDDDRDTVPDRFETSDGLGTFEFTLRFDPAVLEIHGAEAGALDGSGRSFQCLQRSDEPGSFSFACVSTGDMPGPQGTFTLAQVSFRPIQAGSSLVQLENVDLGGPLSDDIPVDVFGASAVSVTGSSAPASTQRAPGATAGPGPTTEPADTSETPGSSGPGDSTPSPSQAPSAQAGETETLAEARRGEESGLSPTSVALAANTGAESEASSGGGGGSSGNVLLWSAAAVGSVMAAGALGFTLVLWRRNQRL